MDIVKIKKPVDTRAMAASALAAHYKATGMNKQRAWSQFIADRALRPEINAKDFFKLYTDAIPVEINTDVDVEFTPTHYDSETDSLVMAKERDGYWNIVWSFGMSGSEPSSTFNTRFTELANERN